jgi:hypothetical protein
VDGVAIDLSKLADPDDLVQKAADTGEEKQEVNQH